MCRSDREPPQGAASPGVCLWSCVTLGHHSVMCVSGGAGSSGAAAPTSFIHPSVHPEPREGCPPPNTSENYWGPGRHCARSSMKLELCVFSLSLLEDSPRSTASSWSPGPSAAAVWDVRSWVATREGVHIPASRPRGLHVLSN